MSSLSYLYTACRSGVENGARKPSSTPAARPSLATTLSADAAETMPVLGKHQAPVHHVQEWCAKQHHTWVMWAATLQPEHLPAQNQNKRWHAHCPHGTKLGNQSSSCTPSANYGKKTINPACTMLLCLFPSTCVKFVGCM